MDLRRWISVGIAVVALAAVAVPAAAHNGPVICVLAASPAQVNNVEMGPPTTTDKMSPAAVGHPGQRRGEGNRFGLYYPVTDPIQAHWTTTVPAPPNHGIGILPAFKGDHFNWRQSGNCTGAPGTPAPGGAYSASGTGLGYCGRSVGYGTGTVAGGHSTIIKWESGGSQLVLTDSTATGSVNAQANPPGSPNGSCLDGGAAVFIVDGALIHQ